MARPSLYDPSIIDDIPEFFKDGASKAELAKKLGISRDTMVRWENTYSEFSDAVKRGVDISEAWWIEQGRIALRENGFNHVLWYMNMKNRFGWRDQQSHEISGPNGGPVEITDAKQRLLSGLTPKSTEE